VPRLFVAVWPPEPVRQRLRELPRDEAPDLRWMPEENWHVTLAFLGEREPASIEADLTAAALPAATATVSWRFGVLARTSLVVPVAGVDQLARAVRGAVDPNLTGGPFRGHVTVARTRGKRPITSLPPGPDWPPIAFDVDAVALVASTLTPEGSRYRPVATFAVTAGDGGR
jgi:2'-5' RNA ligase